MWVEPGLERESETITIRDTGADFVGSFTALNQLPKDRAPQVAVAGRSNVGKSSLLNRVLGRKKLARVSRTPGRTRALNFFRIDNRYYLVDLPGYGYARVSKSIRQEWGKLIEDYLVGSHDLIGLVLLLDCRRDPTAEDMELISWLAERSLPVMVAVTKGDKLSRSALNGKVRQVEDELGVSAIGFSSMTGQGKSELMQAIRELVDEHLKEKKAR